MGGGGGDESERGGAWIRRWLRNSHGDGSLIGMEDVIQSLC